MARKISDNTAAAPVSQRNSRLKAMENFTKNKVKGFGKGTEVLTRVRAVPTIFPQYDHATRVGGHIIERATLVHGPSNEGKTAFTLGLGRSFLERDHFYAHIDAEFSTPQDWVRKMYGRFADHPGFIARRPRNYEEIVDEVRVFCTNLGDAKTKGDIDPDTSALIVVDSLRKLVPSKFFDKVNASGKEAKGSKKNGIDGFGGRGAQIKAGLNSAWLDELIPMLYHTGTSIVFIARESEDVEADANDKKYGNDYKVTGGKAVFYDSSMVIRIERAAWVYGSGEEGENKPIYGERIRGTIRKTKVASKDESRPKFYFHLSNGVLVPEGYDRARDTLELAKKFEIVKGTTWLSYGKNRWQGENQAVKRLAADSSLLKRLEDDVREQFGTHEPEEATPDA